MSVAIEKMAERLAGPKPKEPADGSNTTQMKTALIQHAQWSGRKGSILMCLEILVAEGWQRVPEGSVVVPREPSEEAVLAAFLQFDGGDYTDEKKEAARIAIGTCRNIDANPMISASEEG